METLSLPDRILARSRPLEPVPPGAAPDIRPLPGIRAALFDIYGTLVISASGDISLAEKQDREEAARDAFNAAGIALENDSAPLAPRLHKAILAAQDERRRKGVEYPEVEIREVWDAVLNSLRDDGILSGAPVPPARRDALAVEYECRANPVWPMPGLRETLAELRERGLVPGIVSNAQFYTPLMMESFLGAPLADLGFDPDLCVYSFAEREGKPSFRLYEKLAARLRARGIAPGECLYTGNDQRNDIWPAHETGFRTALFAGDKRSLRLREDDPRCASVRPDRTLTTLDQLRTVLA
ncbi:MAG: HAD family hydrolase [Opitutales bacterium]|nr:HAD family hydrolase [Opitutales bacterium]